MLTFSALRTMLSEETIDEALPSKLAQMIKDKSPDLKYNRPKSKYWRHYKAKKDAKNGVEPDTKKSEPVKKPVETPASVVKKEEPKQEPKSHKNMSGGVEFEYSHKVPHFLRRGNIVESFLKGRRFSKNKNTQSLQKTLMAADSRIAKQHEPNVQGKKLTNSELSQHYAWYNQHYNPEHGHKFVHEYLHSVEYPKHELHTIKHKTDHLDLIKHGQSMGWNARILHRGGQLPDDVAHRFGKKIHALADEGFARKNGWKRK